MASRRCAANSLYWVWCLGTRERGSTQVGGSDTARPPVATWSSGRAQTLDTGLAAPGVARDTVAADLHR